jgi:hypothetical protein
MDEIDDRLAGDRIWELVPYRSTRATRGPRFAFYAGWLAVACLVAASWTFSPSFAVATACLAVAAGDFRKGLQLAESIPAKAGGAVCARFRYAWGAWKLGLTALVFMFGTAVLVRRHSEIPPAFLASLLLCMGGFSLSAIWTSSALVLAYRSRMRDWVGEGVHKARTLSLAMLIVGFIFAVLGPICLQLATGVPLANESHGSVPVVVGAMFALLFGGPLAMLLILDRFCRRVVADRPGRFDAKVPMVGKWES